ncbi:HAD-like domain-containing protein [Pestalotiopsis sp. NC0098]|nr:HAD-like domain-containing protein [Pestalotiopsis sp. NC0098]
MSSSKVSAPKAFVFDVFGTVVNWRQSLALSLQAEANSALTSIQSSGEVNALIERVKSMTHTDWEWFASEWYSRYINFAHSAQPGVTDFLLQEEVHRRTLRLMIPKYKLDGLWNNQQLENLVFLWHKLEAWPDSTDAIARLAKHGPVITLSDGSVKLLQSLNETNSLGFTEIWGSDTWSAYKPDPAVYEGAVAKLGLEPHEVALVAAHLGDLWAAKKCGLKAFYVERPFEERYSPEEIEKAKRDGWVDMWVPYGNGGLRGVADRLK